MKNNILKKAIAVGVVLMMALSTTTGVMAATKISSKTNQSTTESTKKDTSSSTKDTDDDENSSDSDSSKSSNTDESSSSTTKKAKDPKATASASTDDKSTADTKSTKSEPTQAPVKQTTTNTNYTTKGGSFAWFLLGLILNAIISFFLCLRFYKMGKRDNHLSAEIRALRKDISAKFASNIGGFTETETRVKNANPSYAKAETNIKTEVHEADDDDKMNEIYKKWGAQIPENESPAEPLDPATAPPTVAQETVLEPEVESEPTPSVDPASETREEAINRFASSLNITRKTPPRPVREEKESVKYKLKKAFDTIIPKE